MYELMYITEQRNVKKNDNTNSSQPDQTQHK